MVCPALLGLPLTGQGPQPGEAAGAPGPCSSPAFPQLGLQVDTQGPYPRNLRLCSPELVQAFLCSSLPCNATPGARTCLALSTPSWAAVSFKSLSLTLGACTLHSSMFTGSGEGRWGDRGPPVDYGPSWPQRLQDGEFSVDPG